jgi:PPM family protein phosphatase
MCSVSGYQERIPYNSGSSPARRAHPITQTRPPADAADSEPAEAPSTGHAEDDGGHARHRAARRPWPVVTTILVVLLVVIAGGLYAAWRYTQSQYYVGTDGSQVIIYRGVSQRVLGMSLSSVYSRTGIPLSQVPANDKPAVLSATAPGSLTDARKTVNSIRQTITCNNYDAAYTKWAALPTTRTVTMTVHSKRETRTPGRVIRRVPNGYSFRRSW